MMWVHGVGIGIGIVVVVIVCVCVCDCVCGSALMMGFEIQCLIDR